MTTKETRKFAELIDRLEHDKKSANLRMECFKAGTEEHAYNKARSIQASTTLYDLGELFKGT